jgi:hypothetical protein
MTLRYVAGVLELATSTRPTKREIPVMRYDVARAPDARGERYGQVGKQHANEVCGEIAVPDERSVATQMQTASF